MSDEKSIFRNIFILTQKAENWRFCKYLDIPFITLFPENKNKIPTRLTIIRNPVIVCKKTKSFDRKNY